MGSINQKTLFGTDRRVIALGVARMADAMGNSFLIVVLPLYIASGSVSGEVFGFSESLITGIVLGLYGLVSSAFQPFAGRVSDRAGKRRLFVILGLILFMFANFAYVIADTYEIIFVIRAIQGIAAALTITASIALVSEVSDTGSRGENMGIYNSFRLIGFGAGPLVSGILVEAGPYTLPIVGEINGFIASFGIAGIMAMVSGILVSIMVQDPVETKPSTEKMIFRVTSDDPNYILDPIFALGISTFIMSTGFALLASIEPQVNERLSQGAFVFSIQFSALVGMLALVQPFVGKLSDQYGRKVFIVIGLVGLVPITLAQGLSTESWHLIVARALQGISAAMVFAPALALAGDLTKKGQEGAQLSVLTVAFGIGISAGAVLSGYAIRFGFIAPFAIGAILAAFGAILVKTQVPED
ncbi:MAG: MFS transporter [Balneola sp.]|nr:MFS transporter [Balneola sp.]MBE80285.1 MFS transporter [Balneola sp.]|tara:strand:- start:17368 stop:18609 length:1242 start_codon:yes stop_codon:yes gene_type:complete